MKKIFISLLVLTALSAAPAARAEAIVIVGSDSGSVTLEELRKIYFQNGGRLQDGHVVAPLDYKEDSVEREQFYQRAFGRSKAQMKAYWAQRIFTGKGNPPRVVESAKEAAEQVAKNSGSYIAYMKESEAGKLPVLLKLP